MESTKISYSVRNWQMKFYLGMPGLFFIVSGLILINGGRQTLPFILFIWAPILLLAALIQSLEIVSVEIFNGIVTLRSILNRKTFFMKDITSVSEKTSWLKGGKKAFIEVCTAQKNYRIPMAVEPSGELLRRLQQLV